MLTTLLYALVIALGIRINWWITEFVAACIWAMVLVPWWSSNSGGQP